MTADQLIVYLTWAFYILISIQVTVTAIRRPVRTNIDIALLFADTTLVIAISVSQRLGLLPAASSVLSILSGALILALPYMLLRLIDDFTDVPFWLMRASEVVLAGFIVANIAMSPPAPSWLALLELAYLIGLLLYTVVAFIVASRTTSGVTRRRMVAAAAGSISLCAAFGILVINIIVPAFAPVGQSLYDLVALASGISFYLGFATPGILRRAWQEPELRAFLGRAASLPRLPDTRSIVEEMERGAATSVGAPHASIGLWDAEAGVLRFNLQEGPVDLVPGNDTMAGRAFLAQRPLFTDNIGRDIPSQAETARARGAKALLVAPITAGDKRLGLLAVYAPRAPIFADEDMALVKLLADQSAVILESRALIDEAARVRAREEVTRLKEDFLSAAAHDLKTPLTTLVAQTQLLERQVMRKPDTPVDVASIKRLVKEAQRLRTLVLELLDAARTEQGRLVTSTESMDLADVAQEICERYNSERHPCTLEADGPAEGIYDRVRIVQLLENLAENAVKYSPGGGQVRMKVWRDGDWNHLTVTDQGIGIPPEDLAQVFQRFHRGANVDDRAFAGMGLGLYICRGIVEQHGGRIWATSTPKEGTTFHVALPVSPEVVAGELAPEGAQGAQSVQGVQGKEVMAQNA